MLPRISPPALPPGSLARLPLHRWLEDARFPLTQVVAAAGYGKTWLLAGWAAQTELPVAWYSASPTDQDVGAFLLTLTQALARVVPSLNAMLALGRAAPASEHIYLETRLLDEIWRWGKPAALVIDDFHLVDADPRVCEIVNRLIQHRPPNFRLAIASRRAPDLPALHRALLEGQAFNLDEQAMRFSPQEVADLFALERVALDDASLARLSRVTGGWPAAIRLAARSQAQEHASSPALGDFSRDRQRLYDYLASNVFAAQSPALQQFLLPISIFDRFTAPLCNTLLERDDAASQLARAERERLFITRTHGDPPWFTFHPLFAEFLRGRLRETEGETRLRDLHRKAAACLLEQGDAEAAVDHLLAAKDFSTAAGLIQPLSAELFLKSRYSLLKHWWEQFPPALADGAAWMVLNRAHLAGLLGDAAESQRLILKAESLLAAQGGDRDSLYSVYHDLAGHAVEAGKFQQAESFYRKSLEYAADDSRRAVVLGQIARARYLMGAPAGEALELLEQAQQLADREGHPLVRAGIISLKGKLFIWLGDLIGGIEALTTAIEMMDNYGNRHNQPNLLNNLAYLHSLLGEFASARPIIEKSLALAQDFQNADNEAYAKNILAAIAAGEGDLAAAQRLHHEALSIQRRADDRYEIPTTLNWLAGVARRLGRLDEALNWAAQSLDARQAIGVDYETGLTLIDLGAIHLAREDDSQAAAAWQRAMDIFVAANARYEQAQLHFFEALRAQRRGDDDGLRAHWDQSLRDARACTRSDPQRILYFYLADAQWSLPLIVRALQLGGDFPEAVTMLRRMGPPAVEALLPLLVDPAPGVRALACRLLGELRDDRALAPLAALRDDADAETCAAASRALERLLALAPPPLEVRALGEVRLLQGQRAIAEWPRYSARDLFFLLLHEHPRPVSADALAEALWPDADADKSRQSLRRAIADLRRTLEPHLPPGFPSRYILNADAAYSLHLPPGSRVDVAEFQRTIEAALAAPAHTASQRADCRAAIETGLALYRGDFLPEAPYQSWALAWREQLKELRRLALNRLAALCLAAGDAEAALLAARQAIQADPWDEEAVLILMKACQSASDIPGALAAFHALRQRLAADLDLPPRADLTAFYETLRAR